MTREEAMAILLTWLNDKREFDYDTWIACKMLNYKEIQLEMED